MKYYKTGEYGKPIVEVEVTKETDKCVYVVNKFNGKEERVSKNGSYYNFFKTFNEAKSFLETNVSRKIEQLESSLKIAKNELQKIQDL